MEDTLFRSPSKTTDDTNHSFEGSDVAVAIALALLPGMALAVCYEAGRIAPVDAWDFHSTTLGSTRSLRRISRTATDLRYTGPHWVSGSTAPLWTLLLALGYPLLGGAVAAASILGVICQAATGFFAIRLTLLLGATPVYRLPRWRPDRGLTGDGLGRRLWHGSASGRGPRHGGLVAAFGLSVRPGSGQRSGLVGFGSPRATRNTGCRGSRGRVRVGPSRRVVAEAAPAAQMAALAGAVIAPLLLFSWLSIGRPLPTTFYAKSGPGIVRAIEAGDSDMARRAVDFFGPRAVANLGAILFDQFGWPVSMAAFGLLACLWSPEHRRAGCILLVMLFAASFMVGVVAPQRLKPDNMRYAAQLVAPVGPLVILGIGWVLGQKRAALAIALAVIAWTIWRTGRPDTNLRTVREEHRRVARYGWGMDARQPAARGGDCRQRRGSNRIFQRSPHPGFGRPGFPGGAPVPPDARTRSQGRPGTPSSVHRHFSSLVSGDCRPSGSVHRGSTVPYRRKRRVRRDTLILYRTPWAGELKTQAAVTRPDYAAIVIFLSVSVSLAFVDHRVRRESFQRHPVNE